VEEVEMYARVARWEGGDPEAIKRSVAEISSRAQSGPPEGVDSAGFLLLADSENGKTIAIGFFETEDAYRRGDEVLNSMSPPEDGMGQRVAVEKYEVGVKVDL
jgi:hypothetical protein